MKEMAVGWRNAMEFKSALKLATNWSTIELRNQTMHIQPATG
jgi:hypothetical protein